MASSISALGYVNPLAYLSVAQPRIASDSPSTDSNSGLNTGIDAKSQLQALQKQGDFQKFLNDSTAAALFQPADSVDSGTSMTTMVNHLLQQVLGAYQSQMSSKAQSG